MNIRTLIPLVDKIASSPVMISDLNGCIVWVNKAFSSLNGWDIEEIAGLSPDQFLYGPETDQAAVWLIMQQLSGGLPVQCEIQHYRRDGSPLWISLDAMPIRNHEGAICGYLTVQNDTETRKRAETGLLSEHRLLRIVSDSLSAFVSGDDPRIAFNKLLSNLLDLTNSHCGFIGEVHHDESGQPEFKVYAITGVPWHAVSQDLYDRNTSERLESFNLKTVLDEAMLSGEPTIANSLTTEIRTEEAADGNGPRNAFLGLPIRKAEKLIGLVGLANRPGGYRTEDVEFLKPLMMSIGQLIDANAREQKRREMERSLQETEEWLEEIGRVSEVGAWELDAATKNLRWSAQTRRIHEVPQDYVPDLATAISFYKKEARDVITLAVEQGLNDGRPWDLELPFTTGKGNARWVRAIGRPEFENGRVVRVFGTFQDITRQHAEQTEKEELQARVVQSQKMESVGRLAGGIAHDFNNMLAVILGHSEMLLMDESLTHQQRAHLKAIQTAGQRSADLTHQLLTFARTQNAAPQIVDPNLAVRRILDLLRKSIGENIQLDWLPGDRIGMVSIDPVQLDQILASLCMNSRDAISGGGRILISTRREVILHPRRLRSSELPAGKYVMLTVSDTGCGISEAALNHLFEPFNSTKRVGEGSGLGLATVYGIVHQVGGAIDVHSDPSIGTTFQIFLPEISRTTDQSGQASEVSEACLACEQFKVVLLIEDEPALLRLGKLLLGKLGYSVLSARNPREALQLVQSHGNAIHVVISDVVLPGMNGWELAHRISDMQPGMRFVMMSGYADDQGRSERSSNKTASVLVKPFDLQRLASAVQDAVRLPACGEN
jgi:PAS domain S-box-containing protein